MLHKSSSVLTARWKGGLDDVEYATLEWVAWFNTQRLLESLEYLPPAEYEEAFYRRHEIEMELATLTWGALRKPRGDSVTPIGH